MRFLMSSHGASLFGAERVLLALAGGLARRDHGVMLELPHAGPALEAARRLAGVELHVSGRARLPRNAVELIRYAAGWPVAVDRLRALMRDAEHDVVWVNSIYNAPAARAARASGSAVVWHLHERNLSGLAGAVAAAWVWRHCDAAVAPSRFVAESFARSRAPGGFVRVVPNALLETVTPAPERTERERFVIGYVGQLEPRKRAPDVVEAVARVEGADALIVGDGKARAVVERAVDRLNLAHRVRLTGFQEDVRACLAAVDCVVIPSRDEPFGLVALEAMAAGRPVVAARSGALPEVLDEAALYYPVGDVALLAACVRALRDDAGKAATLRVRGFERVRRFALETMLDGVEEAARAALATRRGQAPAGQGA